MIIAFDLDGTISDPIVGITASINYALEKTGFSPRDPSDLEKYIGPPLGEIFADVYGESEDSLIQSGILSFRERYSRVGFKENVLYPGMPELLDGLSSNGRALYIATNKKPSIAKDVADYFQITKYFKGVLGCGLKREKHELLQEIREVENSDDFVMVGDRMHDMNAGSRAGFFCIGVTWGYGDEKELVDAGADKVCHTPEALGEFLNRTKRMKEN